MKNINIWETELLKNINYYNLDELIIYIKQNKIQDFHVLDEYGLNNEKIETNYVDFINSLTEKEGIKVKYFDENHVAYKDDIYNTLSIEKEFFEANKDLIINAVIENIYNSKNAKINKYTYSEELVKNLILTVEHINFMEGVEPTDEIINLLKENMISASIKKDGSFVEISSNQILGYNYDYVVNDNKNLTIYTNITDLENVVHIPPFKEIKITTSAVDMNDADFESVFNIISKLRENNKQNKVIIDTQNRRGLRKSKIFNSNFKNVEIDGIDLSNYTLEDFKKEEELLDLMVQDIKVSNFSPFEKYIAVYNITKKYKKYKENPDNKSDSRKFNNFLYNDYMVCVGYASLLRELLYRVGIETYDYGVSVDISYEDGFTLEEKEVDLAGHARVIVNIEDPKYNIKGFYVADPTWDNDLINDYYNTSLMSFDKTAMGKRYVNLTEADLLLNVKDMNEFSRNVNYILSKDKNRTMRNNDINEKKAEIGAYKTLINVIIRLIKSLSHEKYNELLKQYPYINDFSVKTDNINDLNMFLTDVGYFFIENHSKDVPLETIVEAATNVNKWVFGFNEDQTEIYRKELLEKNIEKDKKCFPYYYEDETSKKVV